ncbi:hypothetical protein L3Q67_26820 [Saccharothrix sp. AJ9571]|nr:hypothetical protein L3Q67_26820 [Saccharothrix sp. AJ9571]
MHLRKIIITKTLRVPRSPAAAGEGATVARQMDAALAGAGLKATGDLLEHVSGLEPGAAMDLAVDVVAAVRELVGDHVAHNAYFRDFPRGVPDTVEFWVRCLRDASCRRPAAALRRQPTPSCSQYSTSAWWGCWSCPATAATSTPTPNCSPLMTS